VNFPFTFRNIPAAPDVSQSVKFKDWVCFLSSVLEKPLQTFFSMRIKEYVDEKRSTVGVHRYADCFFKHVN
jgi:hypothetical protein